MAEKCCQLCGALWGSPAPVTGFVGFPRKPIRCINVAAHPTRENAALPTEPDAKGHHPGRSGDASVD